MAYNDHSDMMTQSRDSARLPPLINNHNNDNDNDNNNTTIDNNNASDTATQSETGDPALVRTTSIDGTKIEDRVTPNEDAHVDQGHLSNSPAAVHSATAQLQDMTDKALRFLSHASNETIGACLVGLGATTYLVLGRLGLMLIGLVGGIALHATWDAHGDANHAAAKEKEFKKRRELGLEVVQRLFRWRNEDTFANDDSDLAAHGIKGLVATKKLDFSALRPDTAAALTSFTDAIIRDYVKWWYAPILPGEESFPAACRQTLVAFILSLSHRLSRKRPADTFLEFATNSSSIVIVFLNELSAALNASPNSTASDAVATYLDSKPDSSLANVLDSKHQERKLALVADDILQSYLDKKAYDCAPVAIFLRQILGKLVLSMTIDTCSKPEWINGWIVHLLQDGEPELMNAIDAGVEGSANANPKKPQKQVNIAQGTKTPPQDTEQIRIHQRTRSRAEEAMDEAMKEAQRLTALIQEEEAQRQLHNLPIHTSHESISESTTEGIPTPASSGSESSKENDLEPPRGSIDVSPKRKASPSSRTSASQQFTTFDQIVPNQTPAALSTDSEQARLKPAPALTLFNAEISIFDDSMPGEKASIKSKPTVDYMIQIEPAGGKFPGWMIVRKYADFETLHEVLRRISTIAGVGFAEAHPTLPAWKVHTKLSLRGELERYLSDAVSFQPLAESEGMKRFLEKDQGLSRSPGGTKGFGWPTPVAFDQMGKNMIDVLTKAPKEVAGGGKSFFGGVAGVLGGKKASSHAPSPSQAGRLSISLSQNYMEDSYMGSIGCDAPRESSESIRSLPSIQRKQSLRSNASIDMKPRPSISSRSSIHGTGNSRQSTEVKRPDSRSSSIAGSIRASNPAIETMNLPPPPSEISEDYASPKRDGPEQEQPHRRSEDMTYSNPVSRRPSAHSLAALTEESVPETPVRPSSATSKTPKKMTEQPPITEQETQVAVELLFAVITELYTLSSAWQIRRTLLNAAKTFLLRPGNPQLEAIRILVQESVIEANTSDSGIATHINTIRASSLPTEDEMKKWPKPLDDKEKEELRAKARKLLVEQGMPVALTGVMGQAATGEALGRVFDCLQDEKVARGLVFGLLLQGLRGIVQ